MLTPAERRQFDEQGYVVLRQIVAAERLAALRRQIEIWIEESRGHAGNYGETPDGKARFDLEVGHSAAQPKLRRVANPADVSEDFQGVLWDGPVPDAVAELIGPDVKFHHCKLNIKLPGMGARVDYHQDHPYDPHSNDDVVTSLIPLDTMNEENGCLRVVPGSHKERYSLYRGDRFVGKVSDEEAAQLERRSRPIEAQAGDVCFMHTWTMHGSPANRSAAPRRLLICDYTAADAFWLTPPMVPSIHSGRIVRGRPSRVARLKASTIELPPRYEDDSFFGVQGQETAQGG